MHPGDRLITTREVAARLGLHPNTVRRIGDRGELPYYRVCSRGDRRYRPDEVADYLARMTANQP